MVTTLLKALDTNKLDVLVANMELPPIDIDVMLYEAEEKGEIKIDRKKNRVEILKEPESPYHDARLTHKIAQLIQYYDKQEANITLGRLKSVCVETATGIGYPRHDFLCSMYVLEQDGDVNTYEISVPEVKNKRPANKFKFYTFLDHQEFGARAVNEYIDQHDKK